MTKRTNTHIGSDFDDFLAEEELLADAHATAIKRVLAHQIDAAMQRDQITKQAMAKRMGTSRSALDRLLDPTNTSVTLRTLEKAAQVLHRKLKVELV